MPSTHAAIWYLAFRPCLWESLVLLHRHFNHARQYPVIIFTFGSQYTRDFIDRAHKLINPDIEFIELPPAQVPAHIPESELFYRRTAIPYVRQFFNSRSRLGYLHAMHFTAGEFAGHPALQGYDWSLRLDDDTFILKPLPANLFQLLPQHGKHLGDMKVQSQNYARVLDCQIGLRELAIQFQQDHGLQRPPWDSVCGFGSFTVFDHSVFSDPLWIDWWQAVQANGGIYKYRWGDVEIHSLYLHMRYDFPTIYNYDYESLGLVRHGGQGVGYVDQLGHYQAKLPPFTRLKNRLLARYHAWRQ